MQRNTSGVDMMWLLTIFSIAIGTLAAAKPFGHKYRRTALIEAIPAASTSFPHFPKPTQGPPPRSFLGLAIEARDEYATYQSLTAYQQTVLDSHNIHRINHTAPLLQYGSWLEAAAKVLSDGCIFKHDTGINHGGYGQNIEGGTDPSHVDQAITNAFYNGEFAAYAPYFGESSPDMSGFDSWGHLTQLLWNDTTEVGCYTSYCTTLINSQTGKPFEGIGPWFSVCNYSPGGNVDNAYQHVHKPMGLGVVTAP